MVSFKLKFRPSVVEGKEGTLYYQITYCRSVRQIATDYRIAAAEWDADRGALLPCAPSSSRHLYLRSLQQRIEGDRARFRRMVAALLADNRALSVDLLALEWRRQSSFTLFRYMEQLVERLRRQGQFRTAETYRSTLNSFRHFRQGIDLCFDEIGVPLLQAYEYYLRNKALAPNTVSFYLKRLRAVCNRAREEGLACATQCFRHVHTATERTVKRAVTLRYLKRLKAWEAAGNTAQCFARDMFLFSFYTRGMSFVDMAHLRKKDLHDGVLTYRRKKTSQQLTLQWEPCMQAIVDRYAAASESPYLFSILSEGRGDLRRQCHNALARINRHLHAIGRTLHFSLPLTMYVARHSWASIARSEGIPIAIISEGMGHDSESTTQIYLASLETHKVDRANSQILKLL